MRKWFEPRDSKDRLSLFKGISLLLLSVLCVLLSGNAILYYIHHYQLKRLYNPAYTLTHIIQSSAVKGYLKTEYLAEVMGVSISEPVNIYSLNLKELAEKLLQSPVIKKCKIQLAPPNSLHIEYQVREAIAYLSDYSNTAIDTEYVMIPVSPFYTPKNLPKLHLGFESSLSDSLYGKKIEDSRLQLALEIIEAIDTQELKEIDLSLAYSSSYGNRQLTLVLGSSKPTYLRMNARTFKKEWSRYLLIKKTQSEKFSGIIDLRLPYIALIKNI